MSEFSAPKRLRQWTFVTGARLAQAVCAAAGFWVRKNPLAQGRATVVFPCGAKRRGTPSSWIFPVTPQNRANGILCSAT